MNAKTFIKSFNRLPTPSECATQIELLTRDAREIYLMGSQIEPQTAQDRAKRDVYQQRYLAAFRIAVEVGIRYRYISVALEAGVPEDHIHLAIAGETRQTVVDYYNSLIKQTMTLLSEQIYPAY
jgi:hypothetical protein